MNQIKIGKFIMERRKKKNFTQKQLAELLCISDKTVSKWECGRGLPEIDIILPLCEILEINVNELLSGEELSEEVYNIKAEENMINLMKEKRKYIFVGIEAAAILITIVLMLMFGGGGIGAITYFLDAVNIIEIAVITILFFIPSGLLKYFGMAFMIILGREKEILEMKKSVKAVELAGNTMLYGSIFITLFYTISIFFSLNIDNLRQLLPSMGVAVLGVLYGVMGKLILISVKSRIEVKIIEKENNIT